MLRASLLLAVLLPLAPTVAGCSAATGPAAPSLLPRPAESRGFEEPAEAPLPVAAPDAALDRRVADLIARRDAAVTAFDRADAGARTALAAGARAAPGSDAWLDAQTVLGTLDAERATVLAALTDLEQLAIARAAEGQPPYPALEAARVDTEVALDRIGATLAERKALLPL